MVQTQAPDIDGDTRPEGPPDVRSLRMVAGEQSSALLAGDGEVVWWCGPRPDAPPVFWRLLGPAGGSAGWCDVLQARADDDNITASACLGTDLVLAAGRCRVRDTMLDGALVRSVEAVDAPLTLVAEVRVVPLGEEPAPALEILGADRVRDVGDGCRRAELDLRPGTARHLVLAMADTSRFDLDEAIEQRQARWDAVGRRVKLPRDHPQRAMDALRVLNACTYALTGAVIAAPTTSLPEAPRGDRQWDYRYSWLRDASVAASVASQLGQPRVGDRYLAFVCGQTDLGEGPTEPVVTVTGDDLPPECELDVATWDGSAPVRVGNGAAGQEQADALGFFGEALWTHWVSGGRVTRHQHEILDRLADHLVPRPGLTNGIWEVRECHDLVSAEIGRWLLLDRAIKLHRVRRPFRSVPTAWVSARADAGDRVRGVVGEEGHAPLAFDGPLRSEPDATGLLAVICGLLRPTDPCAGRLVDATIGALGEGPFLRRYRSEVDDGFKGVEGAFVPASWWAVSALAILGRTDEAQQRADAMCEALPLLMPEEWDVAGNASLGNLPLVWSHIEAARALSLLHLARIRSRFGTPGVAAWRLWRFAYLRVTPN